LVVANNKGYISYYVMKKSENGRQCSYIPKGSIDYITALGDKRLAEISIKKLKEMLTAISMFKDSYVLLLDLADEFEMKNILTSENTFLPRKQFNENWSNEEYAPLGEVEGNGYDVVAMCGLPVRSKSEATIADILHDMGVSFKYEEKHMHKNGKISYPDFKIIHPVTGELIIYEHFGRMDDPGYVNRNLWKIDDLVEDGFVLNETLLFSFETKLHPLSPLYVKRKLEKALFDSGV